MRSRKSLFISLPLVVCFLCGCGATHDFKALDHFYKHEPKTILVLPVRNESTDAEAPRFFMATITRHLIGRGYYILPMEVAAATLAQEGIFGAGEAWEVPPGKLHDYLGIDAILYVTIKSWDTTYLVLYSSVTVGMEYQLVDCRSGQAIWTYAAQQTIQSQSSNSSNPYVALIATAINAATTAALTDYVPLASQVNAFAALRLPPGIYNGQQRGKTHALLEKWREKNTGENQPSPE